MSKFDFDISVIIPFRYDADLPYLTDRLEEQCEIFSKEKNIQFIVVDSGSPQRYRKKIEDLCVKNNISYLYHDSSEKKFSIGEARDFGVENASGRLVTFLDVDLRVDSTFWRRLIEFSKAFGIFDYKKSFFVVPCIYLTPDGSSEFYKEGGDAFFHKANLSYLRGEKNIVESLASCSSVMVVNRHHYMTVGGHRPEFRGHGYEDFELYHRLMAIDGTLPRADNYYSDSKSWDTATYNGFRAQLSLLGRAALRSNLFVSHIWHPRPKKSSFYNGMAANREIWLDIFKEFDEHGVMPEPLVDASVSEEHVVFFGKYGDNAPNCLRDVFPYLGKIIYVSEYDFCDQDKNLLIIEFCKFLKLHKVTKVLFPNPYGNKARLQIYDWCKRESFPFLVFERGALPESWFFDEKGFNADSSSYLEEKWNKPLSESIKEQVEKYIFSVLGEQQALEEQGNRLGGAGLAQRLKIGNRKVLFVPLQRPSDTVIQYFSGRDSGFSDFINCIDEAAARLKHFGWVVLCKKHPLETLSPPLNHAIYVDGNTHFLDLLELSDAVALINSGVGIYSMMMGKPTFIFGHAFYNFNDINIKIENYDVEEFLNKLLTPCHVSREKMLSFINYLVNEFYSFGVPRVDFRKEPDGSRRSITKGIDYYKIRIGEKVSCEYFRDQRSAIAKGAPLFEVFKLDLHNKQKKIPAPVVGIKSAANACASDGGSGFKSVEAADVNLKAGNKISKLVSSSNSNRSRMYAKLLKLKSNPKKFFMDSKNPRVRFFQKFF